MRSVAVEIKSEFRVFIVVIVIGGVGKVIRGTKSKIVVKR